MQPLPEIEYIPTFGVFPLTESGSIDEKLLFKPEIIDNSGVELPPGVYFWSRSMEQQVIDNTDIELPEGVVALSDSEDETNVEEKPKKILPATQTTEHPNTPAPKKIFHGEPAIVHSEPIVTEKDSVSHEEPVHLQLELSPIQIVEDIDEVTITYESVTAKPDPTKIRRETRAFDLTNIIYMFKVWENNQPIYASIDIYRKLQKATEKFDGFLEAFEARLDAEKLAAFRNGILHNPAVLQGVKNEFD